MVKIKELSPREIEERERSGKLLEIAREIFSNGRCVSLGTGLAFSVNLPDRSGFVVHSPSNQISVDDPSDFDDAVRLAEAYESREGEKEWTVAKEYQDP